MQVLRPIDCPQFRWHWYSHIAVSRSVLMYVLRCGCKVVYNYIHVPQKLRSKTPCLFIQKSVAMVKRQGRGSYFSVFAVFHMEYKIYIYQLVPRLTN